MKNLKRALSFALASVMVIGMMVVGAGAAFTDADKIVNDEAVNTLVALNVINGKDDGSFDPTATVTRAEMAKMITVALSGGKEVTGLTKTVPTYTDIKGHWAEGYIEYCSSLGIIAGKGDGTFGPDSVVTGVEAAKMLLTAIGYNATTEKFVNTADWALNINRVASSKGLYDELNIDPSAGLTRDNAAQMIWNGLNAEMVRYTMSAIVDGTSVSEAQDRTGVTILTDKYDMEESAEMVVMGTETAALGSTNYTKEGKSKVGTTTINYAIDPALLGETVKVLYKDNGTTANTLDSKDKIYGVVVTGTTKVYEVAAMKKMQSGDSSIKIDDDTTLTGLNAANIYINGTAASAVTDVFTASTSTAPATSTTMKVVAGEDKVVDYVIVTQKSLAKVSAVTEKKIAFTASVGGASTWDLENVKGAAGLAKDDYVLAYTDSATTKTLYLEPVTVKTVEVTAKSGGNLVANGATIKLDGFTQNATGKTNVTVANMTFNANYDLYMVGDTYALALATEKTASKDYAIVIDTNYGADTTFEGATKVQMLLADGSKAVYTLPDNKYELADGTEVTVSAQGSAGSTTNTDSAYLVGKLFSYVVSGSEVSLKVAGDAITTNAAYTDKNNVVKTSSATYYLNDDAVVFQMDSGDSNKWKTFAGSDYSTIASGTEMTVIAKADGLKNISVVVMTAAAAAPANTQDDVIYGLVTAGAMIRKVDTTYYADYTIWNGTKTVTVTEKLSGSTATAEIDTKGTFVSFKLKADGTLDGSTVAEVTTTGAVDAIDGNKVVIGSNIYTVTDDTVVIYVDSKNDAGSDIGSIMVKDAIAGTSNIKYVLGTGDKATDFLALFVDINNDITQ